MIRVEDRARRDRLAALVPDMPWIGNAPVFLVFCGDARRLERIGELRGHQHDNGRLEGFFNAAIDAALVMQTFILTAETAGLGCCPISVIRNHAGAVAEILELPDKVFPVAGLCLGYPAAEGFVSMRLPLAVTLHTDRYDDSALAREHRKLRPPPRRPLRPAARAATRGRNLRLCRFLRLVRRQGPPSRRPARRPNLPIPPALARLHLRLACAGRTRYVRGRSRSRRGARPRWRRSLPAAPDGAILNPRSEKTITAAHHPGNRGDVGSSRGGSPCRCRTPMIWRCGMRSIG